ncbi:MAG: hypothetical protein D6748_04605 [Calditrichaeota bacterium]|nr:MAG: hypothetical protein D6748_04605 [Calditrichota bacterium]
MENKPTTIPNLRQIAREIMNNARYCALITASPDGQPYSRVMDAFAPDSNFVVWLGTNPRSRKVQRIQQNPKVTLFYFDKPGLGYVSLMGTAELVNTPEEKEKHWKESWEAFYPDREKDYLLIKIHPVRLEVVSVKYNVSGDSLTWDPPVIEFAH